MTTKQRVGQIDWIAYEKRVMELENEGMTRSDAQGVADCEPMFRMKRYE